MNSRSD